MMIPKIVLIINTKIMAMPLFKKTDPSVIKPTEIGIKKNDRCFINIEDACSIQFKRITFVHNRKNSSSIPITFPGIGIFVKWTIKNPILFMTINMQTCNKMMKNFPIDKTIPLPFYLKLNSWFPHYFLPVFTIIIYDFTIFSTNSEYLAIKTYKSHSFENILSFFLFFKSVHTMSI